MLVMEPNRAQQLSDDVTALWSFLGTQVLRTQGRLDKRLDRFEARMDRVEADVSVLKSDVAVLKSDVSVLKGDMAETKDRLNRLERSTEAGFRRMDAQFERLIGLIRRDELAPIPVQEAPDGVKPASSQ